LGETSVRSSDVLALGDSFDKSNLLRDIEAFG